MCGIFGYTGASKDAPHKTLRGLQILEYRGYDSWGIAAMLSGMTFVIDKHIGKIGSAQTTLKGSTIAIGHTRWATHGGVTQKNAHPHLSDNGRIALVHNGIVENYQALKDSLQKKGYSFISETDSEVIAHLYADHRKTQSAKQSLIKTFHQLKGLNAVCIAEKGKLLLIKNGSPLIIGIGTDGNFISSDVTALLEHTKEVIYLEDGQAAIVSKDFIEIFDAKTGHSINPKHETVNLTHQQTTKQGYAHFMLKEIHEQIDTIPKTSKLNHDCIDTVAQRIRKDKQVVLTGCGTAAFCGNAASYYFAQQGVRASSYGAYEIDSFLPAFAKNSLIIAISQSGETAETLQAAKKAQEHGHTVVALVNARGSSLERIADYVIPVGAGPEIAVVSTKAFTAQLATLYQLAHACSDSYPQAQKNVHALGKPLQSFLNNQTILNEIRTVAKKISKHTSLYLIGKGYQYPAAQEAALKIKEISYIHAEAFAAGELKHGVLALIEKNTPCIVLTDSVENQKSIDSSVAEINARGALTISIGPKKCSEAEMHITTPDAGDLSIMGNTLAAQLLAYEVTLLRRHDPDKPRNLAKSVTVL